jgi:hypothetical protein
MKYIIKNSDLFLNGKLIPEGSEIELNSEQTKGIEDFLIPLVNPEPCPELVSGSAIVSGSSSESDTNNEKKSKIKSSVALVKEEKGNKK